MQDFKIGQRWVSAGELHLGIGMVIEVEFRTVTIIFPANGESRVYAKQTAPLSRVVLAEGDQIKDQEGRDLLVQDVESKSGLMIYYCEDNEGKPHRLTEGKLSNYLKLNQPAQRLLNGQVDKNKWFELRARTQKILGLLARSPLQGLTGCRTRLIDHQIYITHEVANRYAPRVLLADEVGLGKTIEAGLILHQLLLNERIQRVLIVVPESLLHQWLVEMMRRFNLLFSVFDEARCDAIEGSHEDVLAANMSENPFHSEQLVLCSLEFLVQNPHRFQQSIKGGWDMLVVDEAHHLVWEEHEPSIEYQLIEQLAHRIKSVLLLTATPEQLGKESHFARLRLLDPDRFSNLNNFIEEEQNYRPVADIVEALIQNEVMNRPQRELLKQTVIEGDNQFQIDHLDNEDGTVAQQARLKLVENLLDRHGTGRLLFRNTRHVVQGFPQRQLKSYALPCPDVYEEMYAGLTNDESIQAQWVLSPDVILQALTDDPDRWGKIDPRVGWLANFLKTNRSKALIICSSTQTVLSLIKQIKAQTGITLAAFHEGLNLIERDRAAAWFADLETGTQAMICSEIGSEGRNFQFAHHVVMFDLPENPDLLEQRIGRLDRIGQTQSITIHVPFLIGTPQQVMLNWLHDGLNAFEQTCPAGHEVYMRCRHELIACLRSGQTNHDDFIHRSKALHAEMNRQLQEGRDRLLEYNSCRPEVAASLTEQALSLHDQLDIVRYMELLYDCYGIGYEIKSPGCWVLRPTDNMLTKIPGLADDGMTITYDREIALANEDVLFFSWEHPFVRTLMDMLETSEMGNTALLAIKYPKASPGTLLLDCFFRVEMAGNNPTLSGSKAERYLPNNLIRICIDENGKQHEQNLDSNAVNRIRQFVDIETSIKVIKSRVDVIKQLLKQAEERAQQGLPPKIDQARHQADEFYQIEINRLIALQTINPNVREEEIDFFRQQSTQVSMQIEQANLRLDAIRVLVSV